MFCKIFKYTNSINGDCFTLLWHSYSNDWFNLYLLLFFSHLFHVLYILMQVNFFFLCFPVNTRSQGNPRQWCCSREFADSQEWDLIWCNIFYTSFSLKISKPCVSFSAVLCSACLSKDKVVYLFWGDISLLKRAFESQKLNNYTGVVHFWSMTNKTYVSQYNVNN